MGESHKIQIQQRIEKELEELIKMQEVSNNLMKNVEKTKLESQKMMKENLGRLREEMAQFT